MQGFTYPQTFYKDGFTNTERDYKMTLTALSVGQTNNGSWRVLYDGNIIGDDRGFVSQDAAQTELDRRLAVDARDAIRFDRPLLYTKG